MFCFDSFSSCFSTQFSFGFLICLCLVLWLLVICTGVFMFAMDTYSVLVYGLVWFASSPTVLFDQMDLQVRNI